MTRAEVGKGESRFKEIDLWPLVVRENILPDELCAERVTAYAKRCGGSAMVEFCYKNYPKLKDLVARSWQFQNVEEYVEQHSKPRLSFVEEALCSPCRCPTLGTWLHAAYDLFNKNGINPTEWCSAVVDALVNGRTKGNVVTHAGVEGNEGKSFLLAPLYVIFGEDEVFTAPPKNGFPLLDLEKARLNILDDWRFNENILSYNLQLLWFEGKSFVIARPQNNFTGHLRYVKDDPIFITTVEADIHALKRGLGQGDVEMMLKRLRIFSFHYKIPRDEILSLEPCAACFAKLLLRPPLPVSLSSATSSGGYSDSPATEKRKSYEATGSTPDPKKPASWSVATVCIDLGHVVPSFVENGVDGAFLMELDEADLVNHLGLKPLQARKVWSRFGRFQCACLFPRLNSKLVSQSALCQSAFTGVEGNEGKSFLLAPLYVIFGEDEVFTAPPKNGFPLLDLEKARLTILDDWRFNENILSYNLQLLWFEGKSFVIARPQNNFTGHLRYAKDDPIFITTVEADIHALKRGLGQGDVEMMLKRLRIFSFHYKIPRDEILSLEPCAACFAKLLLRPPLPVSLSSATSSGGYSDPPATEKRKSYEATGSTPDPKKPASWSVATVCRFLEGIDLGHVVPSFVENGVDGAFLMELDEADLVNHLGLKPLQARKVWSRFGRFQCACLFPRLNSKLVSQSALCQSAFTGVEGNEGKSFLLAPLYVIFGEDEVFAAPPKNGFPLLDLEKARLTILDDWRFNENILSYNLQLLWFEGKSFVIARPQNNFTGHLRYAKDDPIFITTVEADIHALKRGLGQGDVEMMLKRLRIFSFHYKIPRDEILSLEPCAACFAKLLLRPPLPVSLSSATSSGGYSDPPATEKRKSYEATGSTPDPKKPASWSVATVCRFLEGIDLGHVVPSFVENGVDGAFLMELDEADLVNHLGLKPLQARKVWSRFGRFQCACLFPRLNSKLVSQSALCQSAFTGRGGPAVVLGADREAGLLEPLPALPLEGSGTMAPHLKPDELDFVHELYAKKQKKVLDVYEKLKQRKELIKKANGEKEIRWADVLKEHGVALGGAFVEPLADEIGNQVPGQPSHGGAFVEPLADEIGDQVPGQTPFPTEQQLQDVATEIIKAVKDLTSTSIGNMRRQLAAHFGLEPTALDHRSDDLKQMFTDIVSAHHPKKGTGHAGDDAQEDIGNEDMSKSKQAYLITLSHPVQEVSAGGLRLSAPGDFSREAICSLLIKALDATQTSREKPTVFLKLAVFQERHASSEVHYHVAVIADRCFRFAKMKRELLNKHGLASHWSCSHDGYATCVAYGYLPSLKKPIAELDPLPHLWAADGKEHPPLEEASRPPVTSLAIAKRREQERMTRAEVGKGESRFKEIDLWPLVVRENILPDELCAERVTAYAKRCGGSALVEFCYKNYPKLKDLVARSWQFQNVEEYVEQHSKPRMSFVEEALCSPCRCPTLGTWLHAAYDLFNKNGINPTEWCSAVVDALVNGRTKGNVVTHAGVEGNEGKSFLLAPLYVIFEEDEVFTAPPKNGFPLLDLEKARLTILDDWRFNENIWSYNLQLLWFEGKSFVIARPQNNFTGHLRYAKDDPIFITTVEADIHALKRGLGQGDVEMMLKRLCIFSFHYKIPRDEILSLEPCAACFAKLLLRPPLSVSLSSATSSGGYSDPPATEKRKSYEATGSTPDPKKPASWSVATVCRFLEGSDLGHVVPSFVENGVDGAFLMELDEADLVNHLGLKPLQARQVWSRFGRFQCACLFPRLNSKLVSQSALCQSAFTGVEGNEGKSFLLAPLYVIFGEDEVFTAPPKNGFPLLDLEKARLTILDDWRFNENILSYNLQHLWFEGKSFVIARPQNNFTGHLRYAKDDPIFITTVEADIHSLKRGLGQGDVEMMLKRLRIFSFHYKIPRDEILSLEPCAACFAKLLLRPPLPVSLSSATSSGGYSDPPATEKRKSYEATGSTPDPKKPASWSVATVCRFLEGIDLGHVVPSFVENGVDGAFLMELDEADLINHLGLKPLQARKVWSRFGRFQCACLFPRLNSKLVSQSALCQSAFTGRGGPAVVLGADREAGLLEPWPALPLEGLATRQADEEHGVALGGAFVEPLADEIGNQVPGQPSHGGAFVEPLADEIGDQVPGQTPFPTEQQLQDVATEIIKAVTDLTSTSIGNMRRQLAAHFGLEPTALDHRSDDLKQMFTDIVSAHHPKKGTGHAGDDAQEDIGNEDMSKSKQAYLITLSRPVQEVSAGGLRLSAPGDFSREAICSLLIKALDATQTSREKPTVFLKLAVFQERHASSEVHYHVAVIADRCFRFAKMKRELLNKHGLASHWPCSHDGYATCVAYGYLPSLKKPIAELDPLPHLWAADGKEHPPLEEASRPPVTSLAIAKRREQERMTRAEVGKGESRFKEIDLWPLVVRENILPDELCAERVTAYAKRCGGSAMVEFCYENYPKLKDLVARSWQFQNVEEYVEQHSKPRMSFVEEAVCSPCRCPTLGTWLHAAYDLFNKNGINPTEWCSAVVDALVNGRTKGNVVTHAGVEGNEGKSFLLAPLYVIFGEDEVFTAPPKNGFPLLDLEKARLTILDDWRFNENILSYNLQLLWFEGKSFVIARPQNNFTGHLRYAKDDPIFITTVEADIHALKRGLGQGDVEMMLQRLRIFSFHYKIPRDEILSLEPCAACFAKPLLRPPLPVSLSSATSSGGYSDPPATEKRKSYEATGSTPDPKKPASWAVATVCRFLEGIDLGHVVPSFVENGVDGAFLMELDEADLVNHLGLKPLQARKVWSRFGRFQCACLFPRLNSKLVSQSALCQSAFTGVEGNEGKSFLLAPLYVIFGEDEVFAAPPKNGFPLLDLEKGKSFVIARPQNNFTGHLRYAKDDPIFITTVEADIHALKRGLGQDVEMMLKRLRIFSFHYKIPRDEILSLEPCAACFAKLLLRPPLPVSLSSATSSGGYSDSPATEKRKSYEATGSTPDPKKPASWSVATVCRFLEGIDLGHVVPSFVENGVDGAFLMELDEADLVNHLGLKPLQARQVWSRFGRFQCACLFPRLNSKLVSQSALCQSAFTGVEGNEGKSFLLAPLYVIFGEDEVFAAPPKNGFPLLDLEKARLTILDDWRFNENILSYNLPLLWFEGKSFVIARPQNNFTGHLRYAKDDPIFITTVEADIHALKRGLGQGDVEMMLKGLRIFSFHYKIPRDEILSLEPCAACFAKLLLRPPLPVSLSSATSSGGYSDPPATEKRKSYEATGSTPDPKKPASWSVATVCRFLEGIDLGHVVPSFVENGVDGAFLMELDEADLVNHLGLKPLQARKVWSRFGRFQ
ncbi:unnamed protein product [Polarella glacialis]|uniref:SAM domain-containing protein n=1 Tax=Polarella glacialis TaxID=89957 RepID=A0A813F841_POLGL|nr:unnamed protein product [Polarella glacialis]